MQHVKRTYSALSGFSLVELSIVLVIVGLLVGGVLAGQALVRASELRSVGNDYQRYSTTVHAFKDKYFALPGDMTNATSFWGFAGGSTTGLDATCYTTDSTGITATCNGNGNGRLFYTDNVADSSAPEWYRAWQHLANAGLVEGTFSGKFQVAPRGARTGVNIPRGRMANVGYTLMSFDFATSSAGMFPGRYDGFTVGTTNMTNQYESGGALLRPEETWNLDVKLDDGMPAIGLVRARWSMGCVTPDDGTLAASAAYDLSANTIKCSLFMALGNPGRV